MADEVVMALTGAKDVRAVAVVATAAARQAREAHGAKRAAAALLAEGMLCASMLSALDLQKSSGKVNFQLECDGALRGLFVESDASGGIRGYVKNPLAELEGQEGAYRWRPALGNSGYLSVLREQGNGEFFRSSVPLEAFELSRDFERYFQASEQVDTAVALEVLPSGDEPLGAVAGVLVQALPGAAPGALAALREKLSGSRLRDALTAAGPTLSAGGLLSALLGDPGLEVTARYPLQWRCPCSKERVVRALLTLGADELEDILAREGKAVAHCQFCSGEYVVGPEELCALIDQARGVTGGG